MEATNKRIDDLKDYLRENLNLTQRLTILEQESRRKDRPLIESIFLLSFETDYPLNLLGQDSLSYACFLTVFTKKFFQTLFDFV